MKLKLALGCGVATLGLLSSAAARAQTAQSGTMPWEAKADASQTGSGQDAASAAQPTDSGAAPEIVVTAERRAQSLQRLPTTASALTGQDLDKQQVNDVTTLTRETPSLTVNDTGGAKAISIRGVGKNLTAPGVQSGVAFYVDGVPIPNDLFVITPFFDLSRVEVLRGPQGTLVGMNSTGGAILIVTQNPDFRDLGGMLEQSIGNYNDYRTRGALNLPFGGSWGAHVAGEYESRDSFYKNVGPAEGSPGNLDRLTLRGTLGGDVTDRLHVYVRGEYYRNLTDGIPGKPIAGDPAPGYAPFLAVTPTEPFSISRDIDEHYDLHYFRVSGEVRWDIGDLFQLRSVTGFQRGKVDQLGDVDASAIPTTKSHTNVNEPVLSQEFNLVSNPGHAIDWVLGYFYLHQNTIGTIDQNVAATGAPAVHIDGRLFLRNNGFFGQATYHVTDKLNVTGGLRYNSERHFFDKGADVIVGGGVLTLPLVGDHTDKAVTGRFTVDYEAAPGTLVYGTVSRGFKGGGLNNDPTTFGPETIWNYEFGLKSSFLDNHLRTQFGAFYYRNQDIQIQAYSPLTTLNRVVNAGNGHEYGLEGQAQGRFGDLDLNLSIAYTKSSFDDLALFDQRYPSTDPVQVGGRSYLFAPKLTFSGGLEYAVHVSSKYALTPRIQYSHTSSQWASLFHVQPTDYIKAHDVVDASLELAPAGKGWTFELYASNLFNETYVASKVVTSADPGRVEFYGAPRQFGARIGFQF